MDKEFVKEKISLRKDLLKGLFALFILIGTGAATLWVRKSFILHDVSGKIILKYNAEDSFTTAASVFNNELGNDEIEVEAITLPEIIDSFKLGKIHLLKMDCEGSEYNIFYNLPKTYFSSIQCIAIECHNGKTKMENKLALYDFIKSNGYFIKTDQSGMLWAWRK